MDAETFHAEFTRVWAAYEALPITSKSIECLERSAADYSYFAYRVTQARKALRLTRAARRLGVSKTTVERWLRGSSAPHRQYAYYIVDILKELAYTNHG